MKISVIGSGSWGIAATKMLSENGHDMTLWSFDPKEAALLQEKRENPALLPGILLPERVQVTTDIACVQGADMVVVAVPSVTAFSLWVSSAIYKMKAFSRSFFRCVFYLPVVTGSVAVTVVWKWMYNNYYGIFNYLGKSLGLIDKNINWLGDERFALGCIILILLTTSVGQPIVLYVSALGNVDQSIVEAAEVDGANDFQCFWKIKWPAIMPTTLYILVITTINSFQCFALIQLLTSGGPNHSTDTIMYYIYYTAFKLYRYGYGNAMGVILAIMIAVLSAVQFKVTQSNE